MEIFGYALIGAGIGLAAGIVLSAFVGCGSTANCVLLWCEGFWCGGSACSDGCDAYIHDPKVTNTILYVTIIGAVIGAIYGATIVYQTLQTHLQEKANLRRMSDEAQRRDNAEALKRNASTALASVRSDYSYLSNRSLEADINAEELQKKAWLESAEALDAISELEALVDDMQN